MLAFEMEQRVRIIKPEDSKLQNRTATIIKINHDGSALARLDGDRGLRVTGKTIRPDECEAIE